MQKISKAFQIILAIFKIDSIYYRLCFVCSASRICCWGLLLSSPIIVEFFKIWIWGGRGF